MLGHEQYATLLEDVRSHWKSKLQQNEPEHLRLLIERLDPGNYTFEQRGNEVAPTDFNWPEAIAQKNADALRAMAEEHAISMLPWRGREFLNKGTPLPPDQRQWLWDILQSIELLAAPAAG